MGVSARWLLQAPKNGFFYVLDRENGELIAADNYVTVTWASHVDTETGRPALTAQGNYRSGPKLVYPSAVGGKNWQPMTFHPDTGLIYLSAFDQPMIYLEDESVKTFRPGRYTNFGIRELLDGIDKLSEDEEAAIYDGQPDIAEEFVLAWDPIENREVWRISNDGMWNGGVTSTGGNILIQGTDSGHLKFYRADNGKLLHEIHIGTAIMAGAMSYVVDGQQYIAVMAGYGGGLGFAHSNIAAARTYVNEGRIIAFKLDGDHVNLPQRVEATTFVPPPQSRAPVEAEVIQQGAKLYTELCARCHNTPGLAHSGNYPKLRRYARSCSHSIQ